MRGFIFAGRILCAVSLGALTGCGSVSMEFKRGASPDAMATDEAACRDATTGEFAYLDCMRGRGWFVTGPGVPTPSAAAAAKAAAPPPAEDKPGITFGYEPPRGGSQVAPPTPTVAAKPPPTATATPAAADPLARVNVASWWKLGGNTADLDRSIDQCVAELGPAHRPESNATVVTVGLRTCLRAAGWYALGGSAPR